MPDRDQLHDEDDGLAAEQAPANQKTNASVVMRRIFVAQIAVAVLLACWVLFALINPDRLGAFLIAALCGSIGGSLALLKRIRGQDEILREELESSMISTLMPFRYGAILASVTYLLFIGCILTGDGAGGLFTSNLFPKFTGVGCLPNMETPDSNEGITMEHIIQIKPATIQDFAKLLIWSVLSGYSEKFVDQVLRTLEKR